MKGALGLRPVFHYRQDRIRAHIQLCWLALLLIRVAENTTGDTWRNIRHELDRMHLATLATPAGTVAQRTGLTPGQKTEPPRLRWRVSTEPRAVQSDQVTEELGYSIAGELEPGSIIYLVRLEFEMGVSRTVVRERSTF